MWFIDEDIDFDDEDFDTGGLEYSVGVATTTTYDTDKAMKDLTEANVLALKFQSETEVDTWYNLYAKYMGFSIRKDNLVRICFSPFFGISDPIFGEMALVPS